MSNFLPDVPPRHKSRDGLYRERGILLEEMNGINPKLELWQKLNARLKEINILLEGETADANVRKKAYNNSYIPGFVPVEVVFAKEKNRKQKPR